MRRVTTSVRVPERAELARPLHDAGERGGLRQGQLADAVAEIGARGALHAVVAVAEEDDVEIHRQDLLLGELLLELDSEKGLGDLAPPALLVGEEELPGELHGDRGGPLGVAATAQVHRDRAQDAERVDAAVAEEVAVLGREQSIAQQRRNFLLVEHQPPLAGVGGEGDLAVAVVDLGDQLGAEARDRVDLRHVDRRGDADPGADAAGRVARRTAGDTGACGGACGSQQATGPPPARGTARQAVPTKNSRRSL